jgi:hypothetical protein
VPVPVPVPVPMSALREARVLMPLMSMSVRARPLTRQRRRPSCSQRRRLSPPRRVKRPLLQDPLQDAPPEPLS